MTILGILSDTHIPDRARELPAKILEIFRAEGVDTILHAGDVCTPRVLEELGEIAPVHAVRGNRDIYALRHLPMHLELTFGEYKVGMVHGHGGLFQYLSDKAHYMLNGLDENRYRKRVIRALVGVNVLIFGHIHRRIQEWHEGVLLVNPGSTCCPDGHSGNPPSIAVLHLEPASRIEVMFFDLQK